MYRAWITRAAFGAGIVASVVFVAVMLCAIAHGATLEALKPGKTYYVEEIEISGNHAVASKQLRAVMGTKERPFYQFWRKRPVFDPAQFETDLGQIRLYYQDQGYYDAQISYDLKLNGDLVTALIRIREHRPVMVGRVRIDVDGTALAPGSPLYAKVPLRPGDRFVVATYQHGQDHLRAFYHNAGYAHVRVRRRAEVVTADRRASVTYLIRTGRQAIFGPTTVSGAVSISPRLILRQLTYREGQRFSASAIEQSRARIIALGLFDVVRFEEVKSGDTQVVPIRIVVHERKSRQIAIGIGYNTISQFIGELQWQDLNWLGGGRHFTVAGTYSTINSALAASIRQPDFFAPQAQGILTASQNIQDLPSYTLFATQLRPEVAYRFSSHLQATFGYRLEYGVLNSVDPTLISALGGIRDKGIVSGPTAALTLDTSNDPYNPTRGDTLVLSASQAGSIFGGAYDFYRMSAEGKHYQELGWSTVLASRLKIGFGDSLGSKKNYPLFFRFFAGGEGSVRGYKYWGVGPRSAGNTPLGGLSLIEGSLELRRPIWGPLGGLIFLDGGQLSIKPYDLRLYALQFGSGFGFTYKTAVGPIAFDLGFPLTTPPNDKSWELYFSVGQYF